MGDIQPARDPYFKATDKPKPQPSRSMVRLVARMAVRAGVAVSFAGVVAGTAWLFYHGYPRLAATAAVLSFMAAAACGGQSWRERAALALAVPSWVADGVAGFFIYLAAFSFRWFDALFNDKGSGPLGLLLFVCGFAVAGRLAAGWVLERAFGLRRGPGTPPSG